MTVRISIIIPTLQEESCLEQTLASLPESPATETIVADGGSWDRTMQIAADFGVKALQISGGRAAQLNAAAREAQGETLLFLHADTRLPSTFVAMIGETLAEAGTVAGAFHLSIDGDGWGFRLIEAAANWRSRVLQTPYGDQAIFLPRKIFEQIGGFPPLPIMEDFALVSELRKTGRIGLARGEAVTSARRWQRLGLFRTTLVNWGMVCGYQLGISPHRLAAWYRGHSEAEDTSRELPRVL